jgi:hypothetical protein
MSRGPKFHTQLALLIGICAIALGLSGCPGGGGGGCGACIGISGETVWTKGGKAEHVFTITDSESGVIFEEPESTPPWFRVNDKCTNKGAPCTIGVKLEPYQSGLHGRFVVKAFGGGTNEVTIESK